MPLIHAVSHRRPAWSQTRIARAAWRSSRARSEMALHLHSFADYLTFGPMSAGPERRDVSGRGNPWRPARNDAESRDPTS